MTLGGVMLLGNALLFFQLHAQARQELIHSERAQLEAAARLLVQTLDADAHEAVALEHPGRDDVTSWAAAGEAARAIQQSLARASEALELDSEVSTLRLRESQASRVAAAPERPHPDAMEYVFTSASTPRWRHLGDFQPEMWAALSSGRTSIVEGEDKLTIYQPLVGADGKTTAVLTLERSLEQHLAKLRKRYLQMLMIAAGTLLGVFAGATAIAQRMSRSLYALEKAARRLVAGELDEPVEVSGSLEVALLSQGLESMRVQLAERTEKLESERTALLNQLSEIRRQLDPIALQRRDRLAALVNDLHITLRVGDREITGASLVDLTYDDLVVRFVSEDAPELPVGSPLAARILLKEHPAIEVRCVIKRIWNRGDQIELHLELRSAINRLRALPERLSDIVNTRRALRVQPAASAPVRVSISTRDGTRLAEPVNANDLSIHGVGLTTPASPERVVLWGSRVNLELALPGQPAISIAATIRNLEAAAEGGTRLGLSFDKDSPKLDRYQAAIQEYVIARESALYNDSSSDEAPDEPAAPAAQNLDPETAAALDRLSALDDLDVQATDTEAA